MTPIFAERSRKRAISASTSTGSPEAEASPAIRAPGTSFIAAAAGALGLLPRSHRVRRRGRRHPRHLQDLATDQRIGDPVIDADQIDRFRTLHLLAQSLILRRLLALLAKRQAAEEIFGGHAEHLGDLP